MEVMAEKFLNNESKAESIWPDCLLLSEVEHKHLKSELKTQLLPSLPGNLVVLRNIFVMPKELENSLVSQRDKIRKMVEVGVSE